jgi:hypothetical protein
MLLQPLAQQVVAPTQFGPQLQSASFLQFRQ